MTARDQSRRHLLVPADDAIPLAAQGVGGRRRLAGHRRVRPDIRGGVGSLEGGRVADPFVAIQRGGHVPDVAEVVEGVGTRVGRARRRGAGRAAARAPGEGREAEGGIRVGVVEEGAEAGLAEGVEEVAVLHDGGVGEHAVGRHVPGARADGDVGLDLVLGLLHVLGEAGHLEDGLLVARGGDDVGLRLVLDPLDRGALGPDHEADDAVRDAHLDRRVSGHVDRGSGRRERTAGQVVLAGGPDLREVRRRRDDLPLRLRHVLLPPCHHEHRLLAAHRRLDVRVRFRAQRFDLAACNTPKKTHPLVLSGATTTIMAS